jgi:nucleoid-associated protein YgaU
LSGVTVTTGGTLPFGFRPGFPFGRGASPAPVAALSVLPLSISRPSNPAIAYLKPRVTVAPPDLKHLFDVSAKCQTRPVQRCRRFVRSNRYTIEQPVIESTFDEEVGMSALPMEPPPSGDHRATTPIRRARRATPVRQLFPNRNWLLPDGDWTFPGGGESFSGDDGRRTPGTGPARDSAGEPVSEPAAALPPRPGASRPTIAELRLAAAADEAWLANVANARFAPTPEPATVTRATATRATSTAATAPGAHPVRLTRRGRLVLAILAALVVAGLFVAGATAAQASGPASPHGGDAQVFVQPGDTLWSIAHRTDPAADPQAVVQDILQANHLSTASVTVGQRLWVPAR